MTNKITVDIIVSAGLSLLAFTWTPVAAQSYPTPPDHPPVHKDSDGAGAKRDGPIPYADLADADADAAQTKKSSSVAKHKAHTAAHKENEAPSRTDPGDPPPKPK